MRGGERPGHMRRLVAADQRPDSFGNDPPGLEALIVINGVAEMERWGGWAMTPDSPLNPDMPLIPPADGTPVDRAVQRCGCGDVGCGSVRVTIRRQGAVIEWSDARDGERRLEDIDPFRFDAAQYEAEVRRADQERSWETREQRIARFVTYACWAERGGRPRSFDWAAGGDGSVTVCVTDYRPNPAAGQVSHRFADGSRCIESEELFECRLGYFVVPDDVEDTVAAASIVDQMHSVDPKDWRKPPGWTYSNG